MEDGVKHEDEEREPVQTCQRGGKPLIVFGEPAEADGPSEGTLDHPSPGQKDKPLLGFFEFDYDQTNAPLGCLLGGFFSGVALIDKSDFDTLAGSLLHLFDQVGDLGALLLVSCRDFQSQHMTHPEYRPRHEPWNPFCAYGRRNPRGLRSPGWTEGFVHQGSPPKVPCACRQATTAPCADRGPWLQSSPPGSSVGLVAGRYTKGADRWASCSRDNLPAPCSVKH